ncbi:MAG: cobalamin biosynthesis protein CobD [Prochlorococcus sp. SP3034]|nr:cobalamin biosynthesis protein CobD [Prochlorococcus sp. SP3034]
MAEINLFLILIASIGCDFLIGDPNFLLHPVQVIGIYIKIFTNFFINNFSKNKNILLIGGLFISLSTISFSYLIGKFIEVIYLKSGMDILWGILLVIGLSSCFASKNLISSVKEISNLIQNKFIDKTLKQIISEKVQRIVSRDVSKLSLDNLLRAATESLTENSVDGIFAPLFWAFLGTFLIQYSIYFPGPLSLSFAYKAVSTLDSMIGYKHDSFKHLGLFSAKIEDFSTFIPCKLVLFTLPLVSKSFSRYFFIIRKVFEEASQYESPNAGFSQGIYAYVVDIKLGGKNTYSKSLVIKPTLNAKGSNCSNKSTTQICDLILKLQLFWILLFSLIYFIK